MAPSAAPCPSAPCWIACARHGRTAALAAPFKPRDAQLFSIISAFDAAYAAYNGFQSAIERYWALRSLDQDGVRELDASVIKDGLVRADTLPLVFRAVGAESLARGAHVRVRVEGIDLMTLDLHASVVARLAEQAMPADAAPDDEADEAAAAMPLTVALDLADGAGPGASEPAAAAAEGSAP